MTKTNEQLISDTHAGQLFAVVSMGICPDCRCGPLFPGPRGGAAQNFYCVNMDCRSGFNVINAAGIAERIGQIDIEKYPAWLAEYPPIKVSPWWGVTTWLLRIVTPFMAVLLAVLAVFTYLDHRYLTAATNIFASAVNAFAGYVQWFHISAKGPGLMSPISKTVYINSLTAGGIVLLLVALFLAQKYL